MDKLIIKTLGSVSIETALKALLTCQPLQDDCIYTISKGNRTLVVDTHKNEKSTTVRIFFEGEI